MIPTSCPCGGQRPYCTQFIENETQKIRAATHYDLAIAWRFAPSAHPWFSCERIYKEFKKRFDGFGGMTSQLSKLIGHGSTRGA